MKDRLKRKKAPRRADGGSSLLLADPSRTGQMRQAMASHVNLVFARLRGRVVKMVMGDDVFGLKNQVRNVFCPTGKGGGVDPTCGKETRSRPFSRELRTDYRNSDDVDADGVSIIRQDVADEMNTSLERVERAEMGHASKRSRNPENDNKIINAMADMAVVRTPVMRGLAFDTEDKAKAYVDSIISAGYFKTRDKKTTTPESFTDDPEVATRFSRRLSAQVTGDGERNAHGVIIEVLKNDYGHVRGIKLDSGENEVVLPRDQVYIVTGIVTEKDSNGFTTHHVKLTHDTSSPTTNSFLSKLFKGGAAAAVVAGGSDNCGVGKGGFQKGNTCAKGDGVRSTSPPGDKTGTKEFKAWFGASKVVDKNGDPKETASVEGMEGRARVVYHGTPNGPFHVFSKDHIADPQSQHFGPGFYFTEDVNAAKVYAEGGHSDKASGKNPTVMQFYLKSLKPFDADRDTIDPKHLSESSRKQLRAAHVQKVLLEEDRSAALKAGRDFDEGLVKFKYTEMSDKAGAGGLGVSKADIQAALIKQGYDSITVAGPGSDKNRFWIVFEPTQIKSTQNRGTFDPDSPNVLNYSAAQLRDEHGRFSAGRTKAFIGAKIGDAAYKTYLTMEGGKALTRRILAHPVVRAMGAPLRVVAKATGKLYEKIKARYGAKTATRVFLAGQALSWGAFGAGAAMDTMVWIPAAVATAPFAAIAEVLHQVHGHRHGVTANEAELSDEKIHELASELIDDVQRICDEVNVPTGNTAWKANTTSEQVELFVEWLREQLDSDMTGKSEEQLWNEYIQQGFRKGAGRAFDDAEALKDPLTAKDIPDEVKQYWTEPLDFYRGTREEFLRSAFGRPASVDKVKLLAGRTFSELRGVTDFMSNLMGRTLADGLVQGKGAREVARDLANAVDIGRKRALVVARTELIRAHASGQLQAMREMGVEDVGVSVEWSTSGLGVTKKGNPSPCPLCAPMQGVVLKLDEAEGMIPRHPNCQCAFVPAGLGESQRSQLRSKSRIDSAVRASLKAQYRKRKIPRKPSWSPAKAISKARPKPLVTPTRNRLMTMNVFCPTGEGGGVDPSCSPGGQPHSTVGMSPPGKTAGDERVQSVMDRVDKALKELNEPPYHLTAPLKARVKETLDKWYEAYETKHPDSYKLLDEYTKSVNELEKHKVNLRVAEDTAREAVVKALSEGGVGPYIHRTGGEKFPKEFQDKLTQAEDFVSSVAAWGEMDPKFAYRAQRIGKNGRASYEERPRGVDLIKLSPDDETKTIVHEMGHLIEERKRHARELVTQFLEKRCGQEAAVPLSVALPKSGYGPDERGRKDDFAKGFDGEDSKAYYVGKVYRRGETEVLSMGLERMYDAPASFFRGDPEYFALMVRVLGMP